MPVAEGIFDWTCPECGYYNEEDSMPTRKICTSCGAEIGRPELPEDENIGYY